MCISYILYMKIIYLSYIMIIIIIIILLKIMYISYIVKSGKLHREDKVSCDSSLLYESAEEKS